MPDPIAFAQVLEEELELIRKRRDHLYPGGSSEVTGADVDKRMMELRAIALKEHTAGLSFSGGGIRAATFAIGIIQGLATLGLIKRFDYLSTVSGGGYAGGWLAAWLKRQGNVEDVEKQLNPSRVIQSTADRLDLRGNVVDEEPEPIRHLRTYSSYMTPRPGILTADTWTILVIWSRNVIINMMLLLPLAMLLALIARTIVYSYRVMNLAAVIDSPDQTSVRLVVLGCVILFLGFCFNMFALREFRIEPLRGRAFAARSSSAMTKWVVYPITLAVVLITLGARGVLWKVGAWLDSAGPAANLHHAAVARHRPAFWHEVRDLVSDSSQWPGLKIFLREIWIVVCRHLDLLEFPTLLGMFLALGFIFAIVTFFNALIRGPFKWRYVGTAFLAGGTGGILFAYLAALIKSLADGQPDRPDLMATFVPPLALMIIVGSHIVAVALMGRSIEEAEREWWGRFSALFTIMALCWIVGMATVLYVPFFFVSRGWISQLLLVSGWLGSGAFGLITARFILPRLKGVAVNLTLAAAVASMVFLVGLMGLVALLVHLIVDSGGADRLASLKPVSEFDQYLTSIKSGSLVLITVTTGICVIAIKLASWLIDVNLFSINSMYANRLIRCYLGASRRQRGWDARWKKVFFDGYDLILMPPFGASGVVQKGSRKFKIPKNLRFPRKLIVVGQLGNKIHFRIYDADGHIVVDINEVSMPEQADPIARLRRRFEKMKLPRALTPIEKADLIVEVTSIVGYLPRDSRQNAGATSLSGDRIARGPNDPMIVRDPNPVTGFDPKDDFDLIDLRIGLESETGERPYWGPHLLINTTLNLIGADDLASRDRKGESFLLSPLYCGSKGTGYAKMNACTRTKITLGRAISISGAAIDPNMACYQSPALTALLTVFNARLGYWLEKPRPEGWGANSPKFGDHIVNELLGQTDSKSEYVHISDGGHFENLGVYELIRRRCRYIVVIDSGEDGSASDDNMSVMIRLCRIDLGVRIHLDTRPLEMAGPDKLTKTHVVIGQIHYDDVDQGEMPGVMVYIKVSLTGDEPPDLLKYARTESAFPHQPTDFRQSFDEEQFECYRALGEHIAREVFFDPAIRCRKHQQAPHKQYVPLFFSSVQARWTETTENNDDRLLALERAWGKLIGEFRETPELAALSCDLYPELPPPSVAVPDDIRQRAELHAVLQMLELMSTSWLTLNLRNFHDLPGKRGWLNTFRRWVSTRAFQKYWPLVRSEFDSNFVRFCESELHLGIAEPETILIPFPLPPGTFEAESVKILAEEFAREWPEEARSGRGLKDFIQKADQLKVKLKLNFQPAWLIIQSPSGPAKASASRDKSVVGIIAAAIDLDELKPQPAPFKNRTPIELMVWVRRPYRAVGMGSGTVRKIVDLDLKKMLDAHRKTTNPILYVRYPKVSVGGDSDLEGGIWLNFFARFDFRKCVPPAGVDWKCTLLVQES